MQPDFDQNIIGAIMSSYFGGRAEVRRRREIVRALYCDFASMYPTVCTLVGLWKFVTANGMTQQDATSEIRTFLDQVGVADLQRPEKWQKLRVLVQVRPDADIFPARARYGKGQMATIGFSTGAAKPLLARLRIARVIAMPRSTILMIFPPQSLILQSFCNPSGGPSC